MTKSLDSTLTPDFQTPSAVTLDRRALLAGLIGIAAAAPLATACAAAHPAHEQWRIWNDAMDLADALASRADELWAKLPPELQEPRILIDSGRDQEPHYAPSMAWLETYYDQILPGPRGWAKTLDEYRAEYAALELQANQAKEAAGIDALVGEIAAHLDIAEAAEDEIGNMTSTDPVVIAARLHMAIRERSKVPGVGDTAHRFTVIALRDLLPSLPADMAATIAPIVRSI